MTEDSDEGTEREPGTCVGCGAESAQGLCGDCEMWCEVEGNGRTPSLVGTRTCPHGFDYPADCLTCRSHDPKDKAFWGVCVHDVSNAPGVDCPAREVRE